MGQLPVTPSVAAQARSHAPDDPLRVPWRTGRKVGRTIYAVAGPQASSRDVLIGVMDTPALACEAVAAHNESLRRVR